MAWKETDPVSERIEFIQQYLTGRYSVADLCAVRGVSRKTAYKFIKRFLEFGWDGLRDLSHAARTHPNATDADVVERLISAKVERPRWGPEKLLQWLRAEDPETTWPAVSTAGAILKRAGLVRARRKRRGHSPHPGAPKIAAVVRCHQVNNIDFKGQFRTRDRRLCYPLTMTDSYSRTLLLCEALHSPSTESTQKALERCFRDHGLPEAIRSDNGEPFVSSTSLCGLSRLGVWLTKLGIARIRTRPGSPQDNALHERMHRTLKEETAIPPAANLREQQRAFDAFVRDYNERRPHAALAGATPISRYAQSPRPYPVKPREIEYPGHFEIRTVRTDGTIKWKGDHVFVTQVLAAERIGLEQTHYGIWAVHFDSLLLGLLDDEVRMIVG